MDNEETARFTIVGRDRSGQPNFIYPNDSTLAICITKSINYAKGYLRHAGVQDSFLRYVMDHEQTVPNTWYKDAGYQDAPHVRDHFNSSIFPYFCLIVIDHTITNPDCLGRLIDREWDGLFNIRDHCIVLNALVRERGSSPRPHCIFNADRSIESERHDPSIEFGTPLEPTQQV